MGCEACGVEGIHSNKLVRDRKLLNTVVPHIGLAHVDLAKSTKYTSAPSTGAKAKAMALV